MSMEDKERRAKVTDQLVGLAIGEDLVEAVLSRIESIYYQDWLKRDERREAEYRLKELKDTVLSCNGYDRDFRYSDEPFYVLEKSYVQERVAELEQSLKQSTEGDSV